MVLLHHEPEVRSVADSAGSPEGSVVAEKLRLARYESRLEGIELGVTRLRSYGGGSGYRDARMEANPIVLDDTAGDVVVVVVEGEHDIYTAPTLRERLDEALDRGGGIVVDLTAATFVDSSVLGALLDARRRALEAKQGFVVCVGETVEPGVQRILDITGLVPVLPVVRRRDEAIAAARTNGATT